MSDTKDVIKLDIIHNPRSKRDRPTKRKTYSELIYSIRKQEQLSWDRIDPAIYKASPINTPPQTASVFWFIVCSNYFKRKIFRLDWDEFLNIVVTHQQSVDVSTGKTKLATNTSTKNDRPISEYGVDKSEKDRIDHEQIIQNEIGKFDPPNENELAQKLDQILLEEIGIYQKSKVEGSFDYYKRYMATMSSPNTGNNTSKNSKIQKSIIDESNLNEVAKYEFFKTELMFEKEEERLQSDILKDIQFTLKKKKRHILNSEIFLQKCRTQICNFLNSKDLISMEEDPKPKESALLTEEDFLPTINDMSLDSLLKLHYLEQSKVSSDLNDNQLEIGSKYLQEKPCENTFLENYDEENPICDTMSLQTLENKYLDYLEQNRYKDKNNGQPMGNMHTLEKSLFETRVKPREIKYEDYVCQICCEGDTSDGNLIVFCSVTLF